MVNASLSRNQAPFKSVRLGTQYSELPVIINHLSQNDLGVLVSFSEVNETEGPKGLNHC